jgi:hypothetical protein
MFYEARRAGGNVTFPRLECMEASLLDVSLNDFRTPNLTANGSCDSVLISHRTLDRTISLSRLKHECLAAYGS